MGEMLWGVKIGGSLLGLPDLSQRLSGWLERNAPRRTFLLMGGGPTSDVIRLLDQRHHFGEEHAHWLALRALSLNSHALAALLPRSAVVENKSVCEQLWAKGELPILDPLEFIRRDEGHPGTLPHRWEVTTDSVAARLADVFEATTLVLLKPCSAPQGTGPDVWARQGLVDAWFPRAAAPLGEVRWVNFVEGP